MPIIPKKYLPYFCLLLFSVPLFFLNIHDGHNWGDDFAGYIKEALNIAHGKPFYKSGYIYNKFNTEYAPPQYPPGFPLLLAPVVKVWGISFRAMCYFNSVIATFLLLALFAYFRKHAGITVSICLALLISYGGYMLEAKREVLSDVPCLLLVTLYLTFRNATVFSWGRIVLLTLLAAMAVLVRSQAILLVAAEGIFFILWLGKKMYHEKKIPIKWLYAQPSVFIIPGSILIVLLFTRVFFKAPLSSDSFYGYFINVAEHRKLLYMFEVNIHYLQDFLGAFFRYETSNALVWFVIDCTQNMALVFSIIGFIISVRNRLAVDDIFFVLMCFMVLVLPIHGLRYFLPVLPILYYYCYTVLKVIRPAVTAIPGYKVAMALTFMNLLVGTRQLVKAAKVVPQYEMPMPNDWQAFRYIKSHINDSDIILFEKPRILTLFTGKRCINTAWQLSPKRNKEVFDSLGIKYVLLLEGLSEHYYWNYIKQYPIPPDSVRIGWGYTLYTLKK